MRIWRNISVPADLGHLLISNETRCLLWGFHSTLLTEPQQMTLVGSAWYHSQSGIITLKIISSLSNTHHHSQSGVIALKLISPRSHSYHHSQTHDNTLNKIHILQSMWQKDQTINPFFSGAKAPFPANRQFCCWCVHLITREMRCIIWQRCIIKYNLTDV